LGVRGIRGKTKSKVELGRRRNLFAEGGTCPPKADEFQSAALEICIEAPTAEVTMPLPL